MRIIKDKIKIEKFNSNIFDEYFKDMSLVVFDIESMGLSPRTSEMILSCFLEVKNDGFGYITQYFIDSMEEEPLLVYKTIEELNKYDVMLTYNGISFDIPFVKERAQRLGLRDMGIYNITIKPFNLDLFPTIQRNSNLGKILNSLTQKSIEKYLQICESREDEISGKESIDLFKEYITTMDQNRREILGNKILLHNHDDVLQLYRLLKIIKQVDFHRSRYKMGYPIKGENGWQNIYLTNIDLKSQKLVITGIHHEEEFQFISFELSSEFKKDGTFKIEIPVQNMNNAQFVYLPDFNAEISDFKALKGYVNNHLILQNNGEMNYKDINLFSKTILKYLMNKIAR